MNKKGYMIRLESCDEKRKVEELVRESFWNVYRPDAYEHALLHLMRNDPSFVNDLNIVLGKDSEIIGQTAFIRSEILLDNGEKIGTLTLGPMCISNNFKRQGYGKILLDYAFYEAQKLGYGAVLFEGNIGFYGKCGCTFASDFNIRYHGLPEGEDSSFFLCKVLKDGYFDGISGEYSTPAVYFVSDEYVNAFDKDFPQKKKLKLPGQLFD